MIKILWILIFISILKPTEYTSGSRDAENEEKRENKTNDNKAISMMRGKSPRSDVEMTKKNFRGGHLGFLTGISQSILTKLGTHI